MKHEISKLVQQAEQLFTEKKYKEVIELLPDALLDECKDAVLFSWRARAHSPIGESDLAILYADKAIAINAQLALAYFVRGRAWVEKNEYDKAINDYNKATTLDNDFPDPYISRGILFHRKKEYTKAIADYTKTIDLNDKYADDAYYNLGLAYEAIEEFEKAILSYNEYIHLKNDPKEYFTQVAQSTIKELEKKLANSWYNEIAELVTKIKKILWFEFESVTHYTSLSSAKAMILFKSKFRLSEGAFLNDTSEGKELFDYLNFSTVKPKDDKTLAESFTEKPFIGSFVTETKHDDLTLWRMYGKEDNIEAKGCALTINKNSFLSDIKNLISNKIDTDSSVQTEEQFTFYKVAYVIKDGSNKFIIPGDNVKSKKLTSFMQELKTKAQNLTKEQEINSKELLNSIAYLFKSFEYQYESEVRLIVQSVGFLKIIDSNATPPKVFIELTEITNALNKITFGPKVERADEWAAAFNYQIKKDIPDSTIEIVISHLPFK